MTDGGNPISGRKTLYSVTQGGDNRLYADVNANGKSFTSLLGVGALAGSDFSLLLAAGKDGIIQLGDNAGANKLILDDSDGNPVLTFDSNGGITGSAAITDVAITSSAGDIILKVGDAAGAKKVYFKDSGDAEVAAVDSNGNITTSGTVDGKDVSTLIANVVEDTTPQLGGDLELNGHAIVLDPTPNDGIWEGDVITATAGSNVNFGDVCYLGTDGAPKFYLTDADAVATTAGMCAMALGTIAAGATGLFLLRGFVTENDWAWTIAGTLYISTSGTTGNTLTHTAPSGSGDAVRIVGYAYNDNTIFFNPDNTVVEVP